jgi:hypothetical protein
MGFITEEGLKNLKAYKYVSGGYSFLDKIFNHWWEFFVKLIPMVKIEEIRYFRVWRLI